MIIREILPGVNETKEYTDQLGRTVKITVQPAVGATDPFHYRKEKPFHSFCRKHNNFCKLEAETKEEARAELAKKYGVDCFLILSYFEHGDGHWYIEGDKSSGVDAGNHWDTTKFAGFWIPDEAERLRAKHLSRAKRKERLVKLCQSELNVWNEYWNGYVYEAEITIFDGSKKVWNRWTNEMYGWDLLVNDVEYLLNEAKVTELKENV